MSEFKTAYESGIEEGRRFERKRTAAMIECLEALANV